MPVSNKIIPLGVADRVAQAGLDPGYPRPGLLCGPDEVTEINTPHRDVSHPAILATGTRHDKEVIQHRACRPPMSGSARGSADRSSAAV